MADEGKGAGRDRPNDGAADGRGADRDTGQGAARGPGEDPDRAPGGGPWRTEGMPAGADGDGRGTGGKRPKAAWIRFFTTLAAVYLVVFGLTWLTDGRGAATVPYTSFTRQVAADNVKEVYSRGETIEGTLKKARQVPGGSKGDTYTTFTTERPVFADDDIYAQMVDKEVVVRAEPVTRQRGLLANLFWALLPVLLFGLFWYWLLRKGRSMMGGMGGMGGLGKSRSATPVDTSAVRVTFDDVAGIDEVESELEEVVDYLKRPDRYRRLGARLPRGVLLTGPPGTGKTLLARAVAGEAGVPFFSASASEFIEMIVGVGASRIRDLFAEARKVAPAIVFIDEIDTIGRTRDGRAVGGNDEREQTLNQILTEMDGFSGTEGIVVIAATNRPDVLDPALLRPGRFDRTVAVSPPDTRGREAILAVHTRGVPLRPDAGLGAVARATPGMTGADLANLVNEAALLAARRGEEAVSAADFADALEKVQLGTARAVVMPEQERTRTAYHESGHALLGMLQPGADPVRKISIVPRGRALGVTLSTPDDDRYGYDAVYLEGRITGALGGMAAESLVFGVVTTGAESDLENATAIARQMVGRWGMSEAIGPMTVLPGPDGERPGQVFAPATLDAVDSEVRRIVEQCYDAARRLLADNRARLDAMARALLERETLDEKDAYAAAGLPAPSGSGESAREAREKAQARTGDAEAPEAADGGEEGAEGDGGAGGSRDTRGPGDARPGAAPGEGDGDPSGQQ
ncbi:ATP-dependent zinc metalloprotease FtsH [Nocardiopsis chromatogenes]|uniref:ATP-dependent zinc metalloprotease FtsH n=1 Tax=Nocardiopsis chromatogenes TaxID=280239 RepID=UPI00034D7072|nr:ATP-dependent zinc metalloprotease FtsH [Nocardiopsis chromatogenes]